MLRPNGRLVLTVPDGRTDTSSARKLREDESGYWGHVHFWSPESWPLFLSQSLGPTAELETGQVSSGENFAVIRVSET